MNTSNWTYFYKRNPDFPNEMVETNLVYTPMISPTGNRLCMHFDHTSKYQNEELYSWLPTRPLYTADLVKRFFDREVKYLSTFSKYLWAPQNIEIDYVDQKITFDWSGTNCNHIIYSGQSLSDYCPNWQEQLTDIITDIVTAGYYKITLYPHCYFIDNGILRTFDFYGSIESADPYIKFSDVRGMMGELSGARFAEATDDDLLNIEIFFKRALDTHIKWPDDMLVQIYNQLFTPKS